MRKKDGKSKLHQMHKMKLIWESERVETQYKFGVNPVTLKFLKNDLLSLTKKNVSLGFQNGREEQILNTTILSHKVI